MRIEFGYLIGILGFLILFEGQAQSPLGINYQGVARNMDGSPQVNQLISLRIQVLDGGASGSTAYSETHQVETNDFGLFTVVIGRGMSTGNMGDIEWDTGNKWIQIEIDMTGGSNFELVGSQQIFSVPYAMYASQAGTGLTGGDGISIIDGLVTNTDPDQEITLLGAGTLNVTAMFKKCDARMSSWSSFLDGL